MTHVVENPQSEEKPVPEVIDVTIFKVPTETDLTSASLIIHKENTDVSIPVGEILKGRSEVGEPVRVDNVNFPEEVGKEETATIEFQLTNEGTNMSRFRAMVNVETIWYGAYPVEIKVPPSESVTESVDIPDAAVSGSNLSGTIEVVTPQQNWSKEYDP